MKFATLTQWLAWLEQSHPQEIDLGLERVSLIAERLQLLKPKASVITVAGTNGKGSCVTAIAALLQTAQVSVGVYSSPHLLHFSERIQVQGEPVADALICAAFEVIADACGASTTDSAPISLTYFEYATLAALLIFKQQGVKYMVLEVGLGGRLDAVNILDADVAVITSIALDHQDWLGDNTELIGGEKAGILRPGQLFVCADPHPPNSVLEAAAHLGTRSYWLGRDFLFTTHLDSQPKCWQWQGSRAQGARLQLPSMRAPHLPLPSMAAALQVLALLNIELTPAQIESTLGQLTLAGRYQEIVYQGRRFILDVAHNPAATLYLSRRLAAESGIGRTFAIVAMMSDKDRRASLANLCGLVDAWYLLDLAHIPRAASLEALTDDLAAHAAKVAYTGAMSSLVEQILTLAQEQDRILVFGSFFTVAAGLAYLQTEVQTRGAT